jgi:ParB-like chromosome segregation protein Spo0J
MAKKGIKKKGKSKNREMLAMNSFGNIIEADIDDLEPHPLNLEIYGEKQDISDLVENLKDQPLLEPVIINSQNTILSGHRRIEAFEELDINAIPAIIRDFDTQKEEEDFVIASNIKRKKTVEMKYRESICWEKNHKKDEQFKKGKKGEGRLREKVVMMFKLGPDEKEVSERTYSKGKAVIKFIDEIQSKKPAYADILRTILNGESVDTANRTLNIVKKVVNTKSVKKRKKKKKVILELLRRIHKDGIKKIEEEFRKLWGPSGTANKKISAKKKSSKKKSNSVSEGRTDDEDNGDEEDVLDDSHDSDSNDEEAPEHEDSDDSDSEEGNEDEGQDLENLEPVNTSRYRSGKMEDLEYFEKVRMKINEERERIILKPTDTFLDLDPIIEILAGMTEESLDRMLFIVRSDHQ